MFIVLDFLSHILGQDLILVVKLSFDAYTLQTRDFINYLSVGP